MAGNETKDKYTCVEVTHHNKACRRQPAILLPDLPRCLRSLFFLLLALTATASLHVHYALAEPITAAEILDKVDDLYRGSSSHGKMSMEVVTAHWTRTLSLEFWSMGKDKSLVRIIAPLKEKGTATLRSGTEIWNYLPKVNRVVKLPSSMMSASWMGSHFTNDDLVKESRFTRDYDFEITYQGIREGQEIVELTCIPKPEAPVVWGKVIVVVRRADFIPLRIHYYDEGLHPARTMVLSNLKELAGRTLPTLMTLRPEEKPGEKTQVTYQEIQFDVSLSDDFFSLRKLQE
jgi:outer membrane lipoprotein-sorting protein